MGVNKNKFSFLLFNGCVVLEIGEYKFQLWRVGKMECVLKILLMFIEWLMKVVFTIKARAVLADGL